MGQPDPKLLKYLSEKPVDIESPISRGIRKYVPQSILDTLIKARYGRSESEKAQQQQSVPGYTTPSKPEDFDKEDRRESGYFFGNNWPLISKGAVGLTNKLRYALGEKDTSIHDVANKATDIGMNKDNSIGEAARKGVSALGNYIPKELAQNAIENVGFGSELLNSSGLNTLNFNDENMKNLHEGVEKGGEEVDDNPSPFSGRGLMKGVINNIPGVELATRLARASRARKFTY